MIKLCIHSLYIFFNLSKLEIKENFLNMINEIYVKSTANIILNDELLTVFLIRFRREQNACYVSALLPQCLARTVRQAKEIKD